MKLTQALGSHGVILPSKNPERDARAWTRSLHLSILRRTRNEVVLGLGPELFVSLVRGSGAAAASSEERLPAARRHAPKARPNPRGGQRVAYAINGARLVVGERPRGKKSKSDARSRPAARRKSFGGVSRLTKA